MACLTININVMLLHSTVGIYKFVFYVTVDLNNSLFFCFYKKEEHFILRF